MFVNQIFYVLISQIVFQIFSSSAQQIKTQYVHFRSYTEYFLLPWKIPKEISRRSMLSITKGSIYYVKHLCIQSFSMEIRLTRNLMFNGSIYNILYLHILCFYFVGQSLLEACKKFCYNVLFCLDPTLGAFCLPSTALPYFLPHA